MTSATQLFNCSSKSLLENLRQRLGLKEGWYTVHQDAIFGLYRRENYVIGLYTNIADQVSRITLEAVSSAEIAIANMVELLSYVLKEIDPAMNDKEVAADLVVEILDSVDKTTHKNGFSYCTTIARNSGLLVTIAAD